MKFFLVTVLFFYSNLFPQEIDSTLTDTTKTFGDSSFVPYDSLSHDTSQVSFKDSLVKVDTLYPIYQTPFYDQSDFIKRETIEKLDYRFTGDLFTPAAFAFLKDRGMIGQPNELSIYGNGFGKIGFFSDGILYNNSYTNFLDLNLVQSEFIDSIEVLPLPRGFLYGPSNYRVAVNFIERDIITPEPYTRIKYYEGPEGEAFVDGIFSTTFLNMFNLSFDITNRNFDGIYTNSDFNIWQANFKLKYFLSNSINLTGSYSLVSSDLGYFGGVDIDSISQITTDINSVVYQPLQAPVVYPNLRQEVSRDNFKIRGLGKFGKFKTDLNFYYQTNEEKYSGIRSNDDIQNFTLGTSLKQSFSSSKFKLELNSVYEKREFKYYYMLPVNDSTLKLNSLKYDYNIFSASPIISFTLLDSIIIPSIFLKFSDYNNDSEIGTGADVVLRISDFLNLYLGISSLKYLENQDTDLFEVGTIIKLKMFSADLRYYKQNDSYPNRFEIYPDGLMFYPRPSSIGKLNGYSASINFYFWKLTVEGKFNYNSFADVSPNDHQLIKMHSHSGIFYKDILFNRNLDLKTGFVLKYFDFESEDYKSAFQMDFSLAGIIQKVAIVYFSWENMFDEQYFIVPYYPMRERGIRFGLSWELFN